MKLLYCADWHIRGTTPRSRLDDYKVAIKAKILEIFQLAIEHDVRAIIQAGDIFDRPEVSTGILIEFADLLEKSPVPIYATYGQHDVYSYNADTYNRTSLAVLERLVPQLTIYKSPTKEHVIGDLSCGISLTFTPHSRMMDVDGYGYSPEIEGYVGHEDILRIHVGHGMLLDHEPPFDHFSLIKDVPTEADLVLTGDYHPGYGIVTRPDGKVFCNPGSLTRLSASAGELERTIQVLLIDVKPNKQFDLELIPLKSARPGSEILDRSSIEANTARQYAMSEFAMLIQSQSGEKVAVDVESIMEKIAAGEGMPPEVVGIALTKIAEQRSLLKQ